MLVKSQSITQIKKELDSTRDPIGYVKFKLKKKYTIDTVTVMSTTSFRGISDSLAYNGKIGKVHERHFALIKKKVRGLSSKKYECEFANRSSLFRRRIRD